LKIWKIRSKRRGADEGRCPQRNEEGNVVQALLKYETQKWRESFLDNKLLHINEEISYQKIINTNKTIQLQGLGTFLYKVFLQNLAVGAEVH
jgi:hypothetical protein